MNGKKKKVVKNAPKKDVELPNNSAGEVSLSKKRGREKSQKVKQNDENNNNDNINDDDDNDDNDDNNDDDNDDDDYDDFGGPPRKKVQTLSKSAKFDVIKGAVKVGEKIYSKTKEYTYGIKSKSTITLDRKNFKNLKKELQIVIKDNMWNDNIEDMTIGVVSNERVDMNKILNNQVNNNKTVPDEFYPVNKLVLDNLQANAMKTFTLVIYNKDDSGSLFDLQLKQNGGLNADERVKSTINGYLSRLRTSIATCFLNREFMSSLIHEL